MRLSVVYRGREALHPEYGEALLVRVLSECSDLGSAGPAVREQRRTSVTVVPRKGGKARKA